jgi:hypothetical protein
MATTTALTTSHEADAAAIFADEAIVNAVAFWSDDSGSTHVWPQATVDNRPSRVFRRMEHLGFTADSVFDLVIVHRATRG